MQGSRAIATATTRQGRITESEGPRHSQNQAFSSLKLHKRPMLEDADFAAFLRKILRIFCAF